MVNKDTIAGEQEDSRSGAGIQTRKASRQRLPFTPENSAGKYGPVFWLAFILLQGLPAYYRSGVLPESSGLQQRGLHRNRCTRQFHRFPV